MRTHLFLTLIVMLILINGCATDNQKKAQPEPTKISYQTESYDQTISKRAKKLIEKRDEIPKVVSINTDKDLIVAFKINHLNRFQLKEIEKDIKKQLKKEFKDYKITVSRDTKIFIETERLTNELSDLDQKKMKKKVKKIIKLSKEEA